MRNILITNDDGIRSDGIVRLARAAQAFGQVWVVAPDGQRSAMSHSLNLRDPVIVQPVEFPVEGVRAWACSGTPVDCVRVGVLNLVPGKPDAVLSGINYGFNMAGDLQYSATVGAAFEAAFQKVHTIAFSEDACSEHSVTDAYLCRILGELLEQPLGINEIWNVNFPGCPVGQCGGILYDRTVSNDPFYCDSYIETPQPDGSISFMVDGRRNAAATEGTDLHAILNHFVSVGRARNIS